MKKYMTPELSELFVLEDILLVSDNDNLADSDFGSTDDGFDSESEGFELNAD